MLDVLNKSNKKVFGFQASYMELVWPSLLPLLQSLLMDIQDIFKQSLSDDIFVECDQAIFRYDPKSPFVGPLTTPGMGLQSRATHV
jgi:hypothetical protein